MKLKSFKVLLLTSFLLIGLSFFHNAGEAEDGKDSPFVVPKTWDTEAMSTLEVPLAEATASPIHAPADYYYSVPERRIFKTYPVYVPDKEPPGYMERLEQAEPEIIFDPVRLKTEEDWIKAGEAVFNAPTVYVPPTFIRDEAWLKKVGLPVGKDGIVPFYKYAIRRNARVEVGMFSCSFCHTRVMQDGTIISGAQGNIPLGLIDGLDIRESAAEAKVPKLFLKEVRLGSLDIYSVPWLKPDPQARLGEMSIDEIASLHEAIPPGVQARFGTSVFHPVVVPDLIGVKDRRYLDRTGNVRHRNIGDLMRYAALNQGFAFLDRFGEYTPAREFPPADMMVRYSDAQLYALALYIYSLKPPPNPNKLDKLAERGQQVFNRQGCALCHTPPLYTNNKLTPASGFNVPADHLKKYDIIQTSVGTDPNLTLTTRRGTGYYKVPSLKGVWYRGPFEHNGSVASLEDWFDPRRLKEDYVPTGFRGFKAKTRAVKGHKFGLNISEGDRKALIAFLKTL